MYLHPCCHEELGGLPEIKALVLPDVLHYPNDLQRQHVLPQICGETEERMSAALISCVMHYEAEQSSDLRGCSTTHKLLLAASGGRGSLLQKIKNK